MKQEKLIWFAIVFSTFLYAVIVYILEPDTAGTFSEAVARNKFTFILYVIAFAELVAATVVPKLMRGPARMKLIVSLGMYEACAICGFVAAMLDHDWRLYVPTWVLALIGMWRVYPTEEVSVEPRLQ